jgi:hypothetical protein
MKNLDLQDGLKEWEEFLSMQSAIGIHLVGCVENNVVPSRELVEKFLTATINFMELLQVLTTNSNKGNSYEQ